MGMLDKINSNDVKEATDELLTLAAQIGPPVGIVLAAALGVVEDIVGYVDADRRDAVLEQIRVQLRAGVFNTIQGEIDAKFPQG